MKRLLLLAAAATLFAQQPPAFEVASVKPNTTAGPGASTRRGNGTIQFENHSLRRLIQTAYRVKDYAFSGPSWLDSPHFDIVAKLPEGAKFDRMPEMLQALLVDRFKLAVHREEKEMPGFALVVDKKGLRIQSVEPDPNHATSYGPSMVGGNGITMAEFADLLSNSLDRPVKDLTSVPGVYNIKIRWLPDGPVPPDPSGMPGSVNEAVAELGLKLEVQKVPVTVLIVDHAERVPTEN
jgi:uncharacterized protein (TIGR03435 family)